MDATAPTRNGDEARSERAAAAPEDVERALRERLDFEALITDVSARVVVATPETIDQALHDALERLRVAVGADRAVFLEYGEDWTTALITHVAYGDGAPPIPERGNIRELFPWTDRRLQSGETLFIPDVAALPLEAETDRANWQRMTTAALLIVPIFPSDRFRHAIVVDAARTPRTWPAALAPRMRLLGEIMVGAQLRSRHERELSRTVVELTGLKERLESENLYLRDAVGPTVAPDGIVATSRAMATVVEMAHRVAPTDSAVLLLGETGTGKEMLARAIHRLSPRRDRLLVAVNCAALPAPLVESELFGREKARTPARSPASPAASSWPTARRCSWTRWASCPSSSRPSSCACSRPENSSGWGARARSRWTCGSWRPRTATSRPRWRRAASARTSTIA
jgi:transcriptional regulator with GAF, ATPase, and Fis domain